MFSFQSLSLRGTDIFIGMKSNVFLLLFASKYNEKGIRIHLEVNRLRDSIMNFQPIPITFDCWVRRLSEVFNVFMLLY